MSLLSHSMRAYYLPLAAGIVLAMSAFMPWMLIGDRGIGGLPSVAGFWVLGLGLLSALLATLSVITRKNSRHPLLVVGLTAFAIVLLSEQWMERTTADQIWAQSQAQAIVSGTGATVTLPDPTMAPGAYLALGAATVIVLFGMTIVVRRVSTPYAVGEDDDV
ncbi:MAG: hypothetical protein F4Y45_13005 [Acidobacteria bacterium]|nr:hypothetical protein [Acidobacteriota bacterium]MXZ71587.1 hypothetical protein [Acidobacteriota bacterium]MYD70344.1 hypothetical protein [Acidobacteriota bacterium]MYJ04638.1 hypothetical protein [Acidobacteriota bacterium]